MPVIRHRPDSRPEIRSAFPHCRTMNILNLSSILTASPSFRFSVTSSAASNPCALVSRRRNIYKNFDGLRAISRSLRKSGRLRTSAENRMDARVVKARNDRPEGDRESRRWLSRSRLAAQERPVWEFSLGVLTLHGTDCP